MSSQGLEETIRGSGGRKRHCRYDQCQNVRWSSPSSVCFGSAPFATWSKRWLLRRLPGAPAMLGGFEHLGQRVGKVQQQDQRRYGGSQDQVARDEKPCPPECPAASGWPRDEGPDRQCQRRKQSDCPYDDRRRIPIRRRIGMDHQHENKAARSAQHGAHNSSDFSKQLQRITTRNLGGERGQAGLSRALSCCGVLGTGHDDPFVLHCRPQFIDWRRVISQRFPKFSLRLQIAEADRLEACEELIGGSGTLGGAARSLREIMLWSAVRDSQLRMFLQ